MRHDQSRYPRRSLLAAFLILALPFTALAQSSDWPIDRFRSLFLSQRAALLTLLRVKSHYVSRINSNNRLWLKINRVPVA